MKACLRVLLGLALITLSGLPLKAQDSRATLRLTVEDEVGGVLVAVRVTLLQVASGQAQEVTTTREGIAVFSALAPGEYRLTVTAPGFRTLERAVTIGADQPRPMRLQMVVEVTEVVDVEEFRRPLPEREEIDQNADAVNVDDDILVGIPMGIRGDRIVQFLSRFMNSAAGLPSIVVDGQEITRLNLPPRAIDEIVVNKNPYSAEYRRPGRARVEVISQDGSQSHHHGDATFVFGSSAISARNPFVQEKPDVEEMVGEFGWSGPLRGLKGSYLFAGELGGDRTTGVVNATTLNGQVTAFVPERQGETFWTGRLDLEPSDRLDLTFRYEYENETERNGAVGGITLPELAINATNLKQDFYFGVNHILSAGFVHTPQLRVSYANAEEGDRPLGPKVLVRGAFEGGYNQLHRTERVIELDVQDIATYRRGRHVFRFGAHYSPTFLNVADRDNFGGTFEFANLDMFAAGRPFAFKISEGNPALKYRAHVADAHFQHEIKIRPDFTFMTGVRYDWESLVRDYNNVAPRIAFSFAPGTKKTAVRGGAGIFYERLGRSGYERVELLGGNKVRDLVFNNPSYPNAFDGTAVAPTPTVYRFASGMQTPFMGQASFGIDRQLSVETSVSVEYMHLRGYNLFRVRDLNTPEGGVRPDPSFQNIIQIEPTGLMRNNSMHVTFNGEVGNFEGHVVYTYSKTHNDTPGTSAGGGMSLTLPSNSFDPRGEWGRADFDRRHRFSVAGVYELPRDFQVGLIVDLMSGLPYEITTGFDDNLDSNANDRPVGVARNAGEGPRFFQLDMRLAKVWETKRPVDQQEDPAEFELYLDVFNVFNTINYQDIVGVMSSPRFGLPTLADKGRQLQAGLTYSF